MTECSYFASVGQKDCFKDLDVEKYEIVATLDNKTSHICQEMDGKVFDMKDYEPGITAPPFHVFCRSTTAPYFDDEIDFSSRVARDRQGKTYNIPASMTYGDWYKIFVKDNAKVLAIREEYYNNKKSIQIIEIPKKYNLKTHINEKEIADVIMNEFGGEIKLLSENNEELMADYEWNNKLWELKDVSTKSSIDSQVRKGLDQICRNPGGLIFGLDNCKLSIKDIQRLIYKRIMNKLSISNIDVILMKDKRIIGINRYKK